MEKIKEITKKQLETIRLYAFQLKPIEFICRQYGIKDAFESDQLKKAVLFGEAKRLHFERMKLERKQLAWDKSIGLSYKIPYQSLIKTEEEKEDFNIDLTGKISNEDYLLGLKEWESFRKFFEKHSFTFKFRKITMDLQLKQKESKQSDDALNIVIGPRNIEKENEELKKQMEESKKKRELERKKREGLNAFK